MKNNCNKCPYRKECPLVGHSQALIDRMCNSLFSIYERYDTTKQKATVRITNYVSKPIKDLLPQYLAPEKEITPIGQKRSSEMIEIAKRKYNKKRPLQFMSKEHLETLSVIWLN